MSLNGQGHIFRNNFSLIIDFYIFDQVGNLLQQKLFAHFWKMNEQSEKGWQQFGGKKVVGTTIQGWWWNCLCLFTSSSSSLCDKKREEKKGK